MYNITNNIKKMAQYQIDLILGAYDFGHTKADWEPEDRKAFNVYTRILNDDKTHTKLVQEYLHYLQDEIRHGYGDGVIEPSEETQPRHDGKPWVEEVEQTIETELDELGV